MSWSCLRRWQTSEPRGCMASAALCCRWSGGLLPCCPVRRWQTSELLQHWPGCGVYAGLRCVFCCAVTVAPLPCPACAAGCPRRRRRSSQRAASSSASSPRPCPPSRPAAERAVLALRWSLALPAIRPAGAGPLVPAGATVSSVCCRSTRCACTMCTYHQRHSQPVPSRPPLLFLLLSQGGSPAGHALLVYSKRSPGGPTPFCGSPPSCSRTRICLTHVRKLAVAFNDTVGCGVYVAGYGLRTTPSLKNSMQIKLLGVSTTSASRWGDTSLMNASGRLS